MSDRPGWRDSLRARLHACAHSVVLIVRTVFPKDGTVCLYTPLAPHEKVNKCRTVEPVESVEPCVNHCFHYDYETADESSAKQVSV